MKASSVEMWGLTDFYSLGSSNQETSEEESSNVSFVK